MRDRELTWSLFWTNIHDTSHIVITNISFYFFFTFLKVIVIDCTSKITAWHNLI